MRVCACVCIPTYISTEIITYTSEVHMRRITGTYRVYEGNCPMHVYAAFLKILASMDSCDSFTRTFIQHLYMYRNSYAYNHCLRLLFYSSFFPSFYLPVIFYLRQFIPPRSPLKLLIPVTCVSFY